MHKKNIFIFDQNKCVACHACIVACLNENGFQFPDTWRKVLQSQSGHYPDLPLFYLSMACNHCDDAPCLINCPAKAYSRDKITGAVIHDPKKCIGCKYCTWACPFDAPKFVSSKGIIEKCTFCNHRIEEKRKPACAELCPVGALEFDHTDFSREESYLSSPVNMDVGSNIKIIPLRKKRSPMQDMNLFKKTDVQNKKSVRTDKITAIKEWPLVIFTLLSAFLVSVYASGMSENFNSFQKYLFMAAGIVSASFSMFHLGKKLRSWRSLMNIGNSWLSREILGMVLFYASVLIDFFLVNIPDYVGIVVGLLFLYSVDMLYRIAHWNRPSKLHSAQTLFIVFTLTLLLKELYFLLMFIIAVRFFLYFFRKYYSEKRSLIVSLIRLISLLSPVMVYFTETNTIFLFVIVVIGEVIDRIEFYNELEVPNPSVEFIR